MTGPRARLMRMAPGFHPGEGIAVDDSGGLGSERRVETDDVRLSEEIR